MPKNKLTPLAQKLRREATQEENQLWYRFLREYPIQFKRQKVIGNYILDFYCHKAKLAVELDGSQHSEEQVLIHDLERRQFLEILGITELRFSNLDVRNTFESVCDEIDQTLKSRTG